ncbi:hypothetical protein [Streptomyces sp. NPDC054804]
MLYDALVAESRRNDSLDDVRAAALDRVRWLVDLLERQRTEFRRSTGHEHRRSISSPFPTSSSSSSSPSSAAEGPALLSILLRLTAGES